MPEEHKHEYRQTGVVLTFECRDCRHGYSKTITFGGEIYPNVEINPETIAAERKRQIALGYTPEHDSKHGLDHLLVHGLSYLEQGEGLKAAALFQAARELEYTRSQRMSEGTPDVFVTERPLVIDKNYTPEHESKYEIDHLLSVLAHSGKIDDLKISDILLAVQELEQFQAKKPKCAKCDREATVTIQDGDNEWYSCNVHATWAPTQPDRVTERLVWNEWMADEGDVL